MLTKPITFWLSLALLFFSTPFLLFPTLSIVATFLALTAVILIWIILRPPPLTPFHIPLILLALTILVGILVTADPDLTLQKATGLILGITSWYIIQTAVRSPHQLHYSLWVFMLIALGFTLLGILSTNWVYKVPVLERVIGALPAARLILPESPDTGVQANQLAGTILIYWPLLLTLPLFFRALPKRIFAVLLWVTFSVTAILLLAQSRSGWMGAAGGGLFLFTWLGWLYVPKSRRWLIGIGWLGVMLACLAGYLLVGPERVGRIVNDPADETLIGNLGSVGFRLEVWHWGVETLHNFPFTGTGLGTFRRVVKRLFPIDVPPTYDISHAHNIFLQIALDVGLPGLVAYLAFLLLALKTGWQVAQRDEALRPFAIGLVTGLVALHIYGLADALAFGSKTGLLFWLALGNLAAMQNLKPEHVG